MNNLEKEAVALEYGTNITPGYHCQGRGRACRDHHTGGKKTRDIYCVRICFSKFLKLCWPPFNVFIFLEILPCKKLKFV